MNNTIQEFTASSQAYLADGMYCRYPVGSRSYIKFWERERDRCLNGYHSGNDFIPGYFYFYLNYSRLQKVTARKDKSGNIDFDQENNIQGDRVDSFPDYWDSDKQFFGYIDQAEKEGKHGVVLKTRGRGYSFKFASMLNRNYFLIPNSKSYAIANEKEYLIKDGVLTKAWENMSFIDNNTAWSKRRHYVDLPLHKRASYRMNTNGIETEDGYKSEIIGVTLKNDPNRARGKRGKLIIIDEGGKMPNLLQAWQIARPSMEQGKVTFGLMVVAGTGGTEGADFSGLQELFENPEGYNVLAVDNTWEEGVIQKKSGLFIPEYMNMEGCMDENGTSDVDKALKIIQKDRQKILDNTKDTLAYKRAIAEKPVTPKEAMMTLEGNIFPTQDLLGVLARLESELNYEDTLQKGRMIVSETGEIEFKEDKQERILYNFPVRKEDNLDGPVIIYEHPYKDGDNKVPHGLHVSAIDSYDLETGSSLGACLIVNKVTNRVVAEYTARPKNPEDFYEQCRRLLVYYNARALYENGNKGIFTYFEGQGAVYLLHEEPLLIKEIIKNPGPSRRYGVRMVNEVKRYAETLVYQWLTKDYDRDKNIKVYHKIRSIGLLKELCAYNQKINADRVSALICLCIQLDEEKRYIPKLEENNAVIPMAQRGFFGRNARGTNNPSFDMALRLAKPKIWQ